jgi:hypothetical protein
LASGNQGTNILSNGKQKERRGHFTDSPKTTQCKNSDLGNTEVIPDMYSFIGCPVQILKHTGDPHWFSYFPVSL